MFLVHLAGWPTIQPIFAVLCIQPSLQVSSNFTPNALSWMFLTRLLKMLVSMYVLYKLTQIFISGGIVEQAMQSKVIAIGIVMNRI